MMKSRVRRMAFAPLLASALAACDGGTGVDGPQTVSLSFLVPAVGGSPSAAPGGPARVAGDPMVLEGSNGTITLEEIRIVIAEVELDGEDDACQTADAAASTDCADFEAPPRFLDLPLDGTPVEAFEASIPPGVYEELEFEIEDLDDDEDDPVHAEEIAALREVILGEFPDWPKDASALVVGTFQSGADDPISFRVYLDAEIELEIDLVPPLTVGDDGGDAARADLTVDVRPDLWFTLGDGSLLPLHEYDFDQTGELLEFELEMEDGFTEIEIEIG